MKELFESIAARAGRLLDEFQAVMQFMYPRGHFNTRDTHLERIRLFCDFLAEIGISRIRDVRKGHVLRYIGHMKRLQRDKPLAQATAINRLNSVNEVLRALFLSERCYVAPESVFGRRSNVRTKPLVEVSECQAWKAYQALCDLGHQTCAILLMCWWTFGVRFQEALGVDFRRIYLEAKTMGSVRIIEMSKGNAAKHNLRKVKPRAVNQRVLRVLEIAADLQGERRNLIAPEMSLKRFERVIRKQYDQIRGDMKLPSPKEYRAGFACWFYQEVTGSEAPLVSGTWEVPKAVDREAREEVSRALGHRRTSVTSAYLGGMRRPAGQAGSANSESPSLEIPAEMIESGQEKRLQESTDQTWEPHPSALAAMAGSCAETEQWHERVRIDMENLLAVRITGSKAARAANTVIGKSIAMDIYDRYKVRPREYRLKHLLWYVDNKFPNLGRETSEKHFVVLSIITLKFGMEKHWIGQLEAHVRRVCETCGWPAIERVVWLRKCSESSN